VSTIERRNEMKAADVKPPRELWGFDSLPAHSLDFDFRIGEIGYEFAMNPTGPNVTDSKTCKRAFRTLLEECWRPAFARYLTAKHTGLARDLGHDLRLYNTARIY
jgi:hypothetical protein